MRRFFALSAAALLVVFAAGMPEPAEPETPDFTQVVSPVVEAGQAAIWYCAWIDSGALSDAYVSIGAIPNVDVSISLPSPIANEEADTAELSITGPGSVSQDVAEIVRRGAAPGFVDLSSGPGAVSATVVTDRSLSGDACVASVSKLWQLSGGTTKAGRTTILRLYNPFPENAKLTITATSEFGTAPLPTLRSVDVPGRSWRDIDLAVEIPFFDELALTVASDEGLIIPSLVLVGEQGGEASWPGTGLSTLWDFPIIDPGGLSPSLVVTNPGDSDVTVEVDVFTDDGAVPAAVVVVVAPNVPARIPLDDYAGVGSAVRVRADGPVAAVVVAEDLVLSDSSQEEQEEGEQLIRIAGTVGSQRPARQWLVIGPGSVPGASSALWLLNTSDQPVTVTITGLPSDGSVPQVDKLIIAPTANLRIPADRAGVVGYFVDAPEPISAAWSAEAEWGVMMGSGVPINE